jgi:hypothetical protein
MRLRHRPYHKLPLISSPVTQGGKPITWLIRDDFTDTRAAGSVGGTDATPGPGTRNVIDTLNAFSVGGGYLQQNGTGNLNGDPGLWYDETIARAAGRLAVGRYTETAASQCDMGFDTNIGGAADEAAVRLIGAAINTRPGNLATGTRTALDTDHVATVLRGATGQYLFHKPDGATDWELHFIDASRTTDPVYACVLGFPSSAMQIRADFLRVPDELWLPTPLAYDIFTDDNGTDGHERLSDTAGPEGQSVTARQWQVQEGGFEIQGNRLDVTAVDGGTGNAVITMGVGNADIIAHAKFTTGDTAGSDIIGFVARWSDDENYYHTEIDNDSNQVTIVEVASGVPTDRASSAATVANETEYNAVIATDTNTIRFYVDYSEQLAYSSMSFNQTERKFGIIAKRITGATAFGADEFLIFARKSGHNRLDRYCSD